MGSKCKILFSGPQKGTYSRETTSFDVGLLIVEISAGVSAVGAEEPKKLAESLDAHFRIFGGEGGYLYRHEILHRVRGPRRNHSCEFR